jgi:hypothetical protein
MELDIRQRATLEAALQWYTVAIEGGYDLPDSVTLIADRGGEIEALDLDEVVALQEAIRDDEL